MVYGWGEELTIFICVSQNRHPTWTRSTTAQSHQDSTTRPSSTLRTHHLPTSATSRWTTLLPRPPSPPPPEPTSRRPWRITSRERSKPRRVRPVARRPDLSSSSPGCSTASSARGRRTRTRCTRSRPNGSRMPWRTFPIHPPRRARTIRFLIRSLPCFSRTTQQGEQFSRTSPAPRLDGVHRNAHLVRLVRRAVRGVRDAERRERLPLLPLPIL